MPQNWRERNVKTDEVSTECVCPKCGKKHMMKIFYTGTTKPRKYCKECKSTYRYGMGDGVEDYET